MKVTTLKGIFPDPKPVRRKNFIHENVKNLRRMEQCFQANKEIEELQKLKLQKHHKTTERYQSVSARIITSFHGKKKYGSNSIDSMSKDNVDPASTDKTEDEKQKSQNQTKVIESDKKQVATAKKTVKSEIDSNTLTREQKHNKNKRKNQQKLQTKSLQGTSQKPDSADIHADADAQNTIKYKSQGIQTLDTDQAENIYSEGVIIYPSKKITKQIDLTSNSDLNQCEKEVPREHFNSPTDRGDMCTASDAQKNNLRNSMSPAPREEVDFIKLNKERISIANKIAAQLNNGVPPPNYRKGVVPKYLRDRKEAQEKEQKAKTETIHPDCPEGHVPLPDNERKETLRLLKKNYQEYVNELNMMPIKTDTLRAQRRKMEIEKQLTKLEEGIKVFSRPKVYVKINA